MATLQNGDTIRWRERKVGKLLRLPEAFGDRGLVQFDGDEQPTELPYGEFRRMDKWAYPLGWV